MLVLPMLLATLAASSKAVQTKEIVLTPRVAEIAVFKPGLVYVVREATVPAGTNQFRLKQVPQALTGTLWYGSPDGAKFSELRTTIDLRNSTGKKNLASIPQILSASVGHTIHFMVRSSVPNSSALVPLTGKVVWVDPQMTVTLRLPNGHLRQVSPYEMVELDPRGLPTQVETSQPRVNLRFRVEAARPSRVRIVSLETGAAWVANYHLDMHGESGRLESAAQLGLGPLALKESHVRLVSGLPNLRAESKLDLASCSGSLATYLANQPGKISQAAKDPFDLAEQLIQMASNQSQFGGGGGFGGGMGGGGGGIDFVTYNPADNSLVTRSEEEVPQFLRQAIAAARVEDLHTYEYGSVSLPAGGRITRILSSTDVPLNTLYRWNVSSSTNFERILRLHNGTKAGWPAGMVFLQTDGIPVAQVDMPYTADGQDANLVLGTAEDLLHSFDVRELERQPTLANRYANAVSVLNEVTIEVTNTRSVPVSTEINYNVAGTVVDDGGATVTKIAKLDPLNPTNVFTWRPRLGPGEKKVFVVKLRTVVI